jgi:predicted small secreted protein
MNRSSLATRVLILSAVAAIAACVSGCNTVKGAGTDIQKAGEAGERAIDKASN